LNKCLSSHPAERACEKNDNLIILILFFFFLIFGVGIDILTNYDLSDMTTAEDFPRLAMSTHFFDEKGKEMPIIRRDIPGLVLTIMGKLLLECAKQYKCESVPEAMKKVEVLKTEYIKYIKKRTISQGLNLLFLTPVTLFKRSIPYLIMIYFNHKYFIGFSCYAIKMLLHLLLNYCEVYVYLSTH